MRMVKRVRVCVRVASLVVLASRDGRMDVVVSVRRECWHWESLHVVDLID